VALRRVTVLDSSGAPVDLSEYIGSDESDAAAAAAIEAAASAQSVVARAADGAGAGDVDTVAIDGTPAAASADAATDISVVLEP